MKEKQTKKHFIQPTLPVSVVTLSGNLGTVRNLTVVVLIPLNCFFDYSFSTSEEGYVWEEKI